MTRITMNNGTTLLVDISVEEAFTKLQGASRGQGRGVTVFVPFMSATSEADLPVYVNIDQISMIAEAE